jgi:hypothetical protein
MRNGGFAVVVEDCDEEPHRGICDLRGGCLHELFTIGRDKPALRVGADGFVNCHALC